MPRKRALLTASLGFLLTLLSCSTPDRPTLLYAFTDGFIGSWSLTLYKDGEFQLFLPAADGTGRFRLAGDTVFLTYTEPSPTLPAAYYINRPRKKIDELEQVGGKWVIAEQNDWAQLYKDSTRYYAR